MNLDPSQQRAVELVCTAQFGVVTGGPGTGKTTSLRAALDRLDAEGAIVELASPTGKAARRMQEATGRDARTVHRLLEYRPGAGFERDARHPIDADLVVIDEASMLDVELASHLVDAVQGDTRLVLVGDADQLPSVGPGKVFADLISSARCPVARLTTLHRAAAESWVCSQAPVILSGRVPDLRARPDFRWVEREGRDDAAAAVTELVARRLPFEGIAAEDVQVLVPQNVGPAGADVLNASLQHLLNDAPPGSGWKVGKQELRPGDRVIQTKNDYGIGVMNGEVGTVVRFEERALFVDFGGTDLVSYDRDRAGCLRLAYALSVHKSQGSEWPWVVVLVHSTHTQMLTRNLLYTAITRAKKGVVIVGDRAGIERAVANVSDVRRQTALVEELRDRRRSRRELGAVKLSRRDRLAMQLALECVRARDRWGAIDASVRLDGAYNALRLLGPMLDDHTARLPAWRLFKALHDAFRAGPYIDPRLFRARLALYLRAVLRADAGDYGPLDWWCMRCLRSVARVGHEANCRGRGSIVYAPGRITPAWETAPAHDGRTLRERRAEP